MPTDIEPSSTWIATAILDRVVADWSRGALASREEYERQFPGQEAAVRFALEEVERGEAQRARGGEELEPPSDPATGEELWAAPPLAPQRLAGFELLRLLGRGGQGEVHLARDSRLGRLVALKVLTGWNALRPESVARFLREAEVASQLDHPGICTVHQSGREGATLWIAMQYVPGDTLARALAARRAEAEGDAAALLPDAAAARLEARTRAGLERTLQCAEDVARALHYAHLRGVVHRDVKPGNVMLTPEGRPVVLDFGLARRFEDEAETVTLSGAQVGTPAYMAPEQLTHGPAAADARSDVYALGVTLYEMLTGRRPFEAPTREALFARIAEARPRDARALNPLVDRDLAVVLQTALDPDPQRRYLTAEDFAEDLRRVRERRPILAQPPSSWTRIRRGYQRNPALATAVAALVLVLAVGLATTLGLLREANAQRNLALRRTAEYARLAAERNLRELQAEATPELLQAHPGRVPAMEDWLARARALVAELPRHREVLDALRADGRRREPAEVVAARPAAGRALAEVERRLAAVALEVDAARAAGDEEGARGWEERAAELEAERAAARAALADPALVWAFEDDADAWRHEQLVRLVADLEALRADDTRPGAVTLPAVEARLARARAVHERSVLRAGERWDAARASVAADPRFAGLDLRPIPGLLPLGPDPESGLLELAVLDSGEPPARGADGRLALAPESALVLVLVPGGESRVGTPPGEPLEQLNEGGRAVRLEPYLIGKHEVTQAQWRRVMGTNPSAYSPGYSREASGELGVVTLAHPVEAVSWHDATALARRLRLELPTEAQWEHAARSGTRGRYLWGDGPDALRGHENLRDERFESQLGESAQWSDGFLVHAPVGSFAPGPWGLHDVLGNVFEWTRDPYRIRPLEARAGTEPDGLDLSAGGEQRATRGGSWYAPPAFCRVTLRRALPAGTTDPATGVRVARGLEP